MRKIFLIVAVTATGLSQAAIAQLAGARQGRTEIKSSSQVTPLRGEALKVSDAPLSPAPTPQSDLQASLSVSYNKETKKFLVKGRVINLGPDTYQGKTRYAHLRVTSGVIAKPDKSCEKCANVVGSANTHDVRVEQIPALTIASGAGKFYTAFDISAEVDRQEDDDKNTYTYYFELYLDSSQSDPNPKNDEAAFAASNIGRGK